MKVLGELEKSSDTGNNERFLNVPNDEDYNEKWNSILDALAQIYPYMEEPHQDESRLFCSKIAVLI